MEYPKPLDHLINFVNLRGSRIILFFINFGNHVLINFGKTCLILVINVFYFLSSQLPNIIVSYFFISPLFFY